MGFLPSVTFLSYKPIWLLLGSLGFPKLEGRSLVVFQRSHLRARRNRKYLAGPSLHHGGEDAGGDVLVHAASRGPRGPISHWTFGHRKCQKWGLPPQIWYFRLVSRETNT